MENAGSESVCTYLYSIGVIFHGNVLGNKVNSKYFYLVSVIFAREFYAYEYKSFKLKLSNLMIIVNCH